MPDPLRHEVERQIEAIIARGALGASERQARLLRYLVEQELDGSGARIKAYAIGTEVFGRPLSFDPDHDSIVRTEMARLRKALALHNATQGVGDAVRITLAPGSFRPGIEATAGQAGELALPPRDGSSAPVAEPASIDATSGPSEGPAPEAKRAKGLHVLAHLGLVLGLGLVFVYAVWSQFGREPIGTGSTSITARPTSATEARRTTRPVLSVKAVEPFSQDDAQERHAAQHMTGDLVSRLADNSWLAVESPGAMPSSPLTEPEYRLTLDATVDVDDKDTTLVVRVRQEASDTVLWTRRYQTQMPGTPPQIAQQLAFAASSEVGRLFGPLSEIYIAAAIANAATSPSAVSCTMLGYAFIRSVSPRLLEEAETCLMAALPRNEWSPELHAMLALIKLERLDFQPMTEAEAASVIRQARFHVERARQLAPGLLIVRIAMIVSDYFGDDHDRLREELQKIIKAEPNNAVASFYYIIRTAHVLGDWERAMKHNEHAMMVMPEHPRRSRLVALQHALVDNDLPRARRVVDQISTIRTPRVALTRLATAGLSHDRNRVIMEKGKLADLGVSGPEQILMLARNMRVAEAARPVIIDGLNKAFELAGPR